MKVKPPIWDRNKKSGQFSMIWKIQKIQGNWVQNRKHRKSHICRTDSVPCDRARGSAKCSVPCDHAHESLWPCLGVRKVLSSLLLRSWVPVTVLEGPRNAQFPVTTLRSPCDRAQESAKCSVPCDRAQESLWLCSGVYEVLSSLLLRSGVHCSIQVGSRGGGHNFSCD